jgi:hypothetical protein
MGQHSLIARSGGGGARSVIFNFSNLEIGRFLPFRGILENFGTLLIWNFSNLGRLKIYVKKCKIIQIKFGYVEKNSELRGRNEGGSPHKDTKV